ncbi:MAG: CdaR family protein [Bacteroidales bacterium]
MLSAFFWFLQILREDITTTYSFRVNIEDIPKNILITSKVPDLEVKFKDQGANMFNFLRKGDETLVLNFNPKDMKSGRYTLTTDDILSLVQKSLPPTSQVVSVYPNNFVLYYSIGQSKQIPVEVRGNFITKQQYMISGPIAVQPEMVTAYAPEDVLSGLTYCETDSITALNLSENFTKEVNIKGIPGVKFYPDVVRVEVPVESFTQKEFQVPVTIINLPADKALRTFPAKASLTCFVALSKYKELTENLFKLQIDFKETQSSVSNKLKINLIEYPLFVTNVQLATDSVEYIIEDKIIHD